MPNKAVHSRSLYDIIYIFGGSHNKTTVNK